mgnify:CR=1 FL=1
MRCAGEVVNCTHVWEPCWGWSGRYRCKECRVLAYKHLVLTPTGDKALPRAGSPDAMDVYLCKKKGCGKGAVTHGKSQLCKDHADEKGRKG